MRYFLLPRVCLCFSINVNVSGGTFIQNPKLIFSRTTIRASVLSVMEFGSSLGIKMTYKADLEVVFTPKVWSSGGPPELI